MDHTNGNAMDVDVDGALGESSDPFMPLNLVSMKMKFDFGLFSRS